jgi:hypothetical protein
MSKKTKSTKPWSGKDAVQWMAVAHIEGRRGVKGLLFKDLSSSLEDSS